MKELKNLSTQELYDLYPIVLELREKVLKLCQEYGYNAESLVNRNFEHDIERYYGRNVLDARSKR